MFQNAYSYADTMHAIANSYYIYAQKKENKFRSPGNDLKIIISSIILPILLLAIKVISSKIAQKA